MVSAKGVLGVSSDPGLWKPFKHGQGPCLLRMFRVPILLPITVVWLQNRYSSAWMYQDDYYICVVCCSRNSLHQVENRSYLSTCTGLTWPYLHIPAWYWQCGNWGFAVPGGGGPRRVANRVFCLHAYPVIMQPFVSHGEDSWLWWKQFNSFILICMDRQSQKFLICTDHLALQWHRVFWQPQGQTARWPDCFDTGCKHCSKRTSLKGHSWQPI